MDIGKCGTFWNLRIDPDGHCSCQVKSSCVCVCAGRGRSRVPSATQWPTMELTACYCSSYSTGQIIFCLREANSCGRPFGVAHLSSLLSLLLSSLWNSPLITWGTSLYWSRDSVGQVTVQQPLRWQSVLVRCVHDKWFGPVFSDWNCCERAPSLRLFRLPTTVWCFISFTRLLCSAAILVWTVSWQHLDQGSESEAFFQVWHENTSEKSAMRLDGTWITSFHESFSWVNWIEKSFQPLQRKKLKVWPKVIVIPEACKFPFHVMWLTLSFTLLWKITESGHVEEKHISCKRILFHGKMKVICDLPRCLKRKAVLTSNRYSLQIRWGQCFWILFLSFLSMSFTVLELHSTLGYVFVIWHSLSFLTFSLWNDWTPMQNTVLSWGDGWMWVFFFFFFLNLLCLLLVTTWKT